MFMSFTPKYDFSFKRMLLMKEFFGMHNSLWNAKWLVHWDKLASKNQICLIVKKSQNPATCFAIKRYTHVNIK